MISAIKKKLSLKISVVLALVMIALIVPVALWIIINQTAALEDLTLEKAELAADNGAQMYTLILESAIESGLLSVDDVFDVKYEEIKGYNWGEFPKFHTKYDFYTDKSVIVFQDAFLGNPDFLYAVGQDVNGYVPTHNSKYQKQVTGDPGKDLNGNRTKRIYKDEVGQIASRNEAAGFQQIYTRDTGAVLWDVSSPVYVKGKHWGCFRIGVSIDRIQSHKKHLILVLIALLGGFALVVTISIFLLVKRAMIPIDKLTARAKRVSVGKELDVKIVPNSEDEIGALAKAVDRLRASLQAAMERLGE